MLIVLYSLRTVQVLNSQCAGGPRAAKTFGGGGGMPPGPPLATGLICSVQSFAAILQ